MSHSKSHLSDASLTQGLALAVQNERASTVEVLAHIAEFSRRRLFRPAGYSSMHTYCVGVLHLSEQAAYKRVTAARAARRFPDLFNAIGDGRLHLTGLLLIAPHLRNWNFQELLDLATHRTRREIEELLAMRFPRPDAPTRIVPLVRPVESQPGLAVHQRAGESHDSKSPGLSASDLPQQLLAREETGSLSSSPGTLSSGMAPSDSGGDPSEFAMDTCQELSPGRVPDISRTQGFEFPRVQPLAPERFALQVTIDAETHGLLRRAQELVGFQVPSNDVAEILKRALALLVSKLEKRKFATVNSPGLSADATSSEESQIPDSTSSGESQIPDSTAERNPRHIPAWVKRAVWQRDGGRCTYVSAQGVRCDSRRVEFDHIVPVARGGDSSVSNVRLLCRPHNQMAAEAQFGMEFMRAKRSQSGDLLRPTA